jgi:hypothetical protein
LDDLKCGGALRRREARLFVADRLRRMKRWSSARQLDINSSIRARILDTCQIYSAASETRRPGKDNATLAPWHQVESNGDR